MAQPRYYSWEQANTTYVASLQSLADKDELKLTSHIPNFNGNKRTVSITSGDDLSLVNFTIIGLLEGGAQVSETISGPNNGTVEGSLFFEQVYGISYDASEEKASSEVSAGSGTSGFMPWYFYNSESTFPALGVQTGVTGTINYSFVATMFDIAGLSTVYSPIKAEVPLFTPINALAYATDSQFGAFSDPATYVSVKINKSTDGALQLALIQEGIN